MRYPHLLESTREIFLSALTEKNIVTEEKIRKEALAKIRANEQDPDEESLREYMGAIIDLYFANSFSKAEIENYINLARKQDRFKNLNRVINKEGATSRKIKQALKEFCEIPMGGLHISPNEAEGARVALINHFISNQLPFIGTFAANHEFIKGLPQNIRTMIDNAIEGANEYIFDFEPKLNEQRKQMIMEAKPSMQYIELTDKEIAVFREKAKPLRQKYLKMGGEGAEEVLNAVIKDIMWAKEN